MASSILLELERAELAARERRLSAEAEAERLVGDARERAEATEAGVEQSIVEAIRRRRRTVLAGARQEVRALEKQIGELERAPSAVRDPAVERAVELVVAAVLAESDAEGR